MLDKASHNQIKISLIIPAIIISLVVSLVGTIFTYYCISFDNSRDKTSEKQTTISLNNLSYFIENKGQVNDNEVRFFHSSGSMYFYDSKIIMINDKNGEQIRIHITYPQSNFVKPIGTYDNVHKSNYIHGNNSGYWYTNISNFNQITYNNIYENIDLTFYYSENGVKYDWIIHAGANPDVITEKYDGINTISISNSGELLLFTDHTTLTIDRPYTYQETTIIDSSYNIIDNQTISYEIGKYDPSIDLIIDPLIDSTYVGGSQYDYGNEVVVDEDDEIYVVGTTSSSNFPRKNALDSSYNGGDSDIFIFKMTNDCSDIIFSTFIGGDDEDEGFSIAIDDNNDIYITGSTKSSDFPTSDEAYDTSHNGEDDVFVVKISNDGSELQYSTLIGEDNLDVGISIEVDVDGYAYVAGDTGSWEFPTTNNAYDTEHGHQYDIFLLKLETDGSDLVYSTFIGDSDSEQVGDMTLDDQKNAYITGYTDSSDFPTTDDVYDDSINGQDDIFISKVNNDGTDLVFSTFVGGNQNDYGKGITIDENNNVYIAGSTQSNNFPVTDNVYQGIRSGSTDSCLLKILNDGSDISFSTYIGGSEYDIAYGISVDNKNVTIIGITISDDFPITNSAFDNTRNEEEVFISIIDDSGSKLIYSTFLGGNIDEKGYSVERDSEGNLLVAGVTDSTNFPTTDEAYDQSNNGYSEVFVTKINTNIPKAKITNIDPTSSEEGGEVSFQGKGYDIKGNITAYQWRSSLDEIISYDSNFTKHNLTPGDHTIYFSVFNENGHWSPEEKITFRVNNVIPKAYIDSITPIISNLGDTITFKASGTDALGGIHEYQWRSSLDGVFSVLNNCTFSEFSAGTHTIYLKVIDTEYSWSNPVSQTIYVNAMPTAYINNINPASTDEGANVTFKGRGIDTAGGTIVGYYWESSIDGYLSDNRTFSISNLSAGTHIIQLKVLDDLGGWSPPVTQELIINSIPVAIIDSIEPLKINENDMVELKGSGIDQEGIILQYRWHSSLDSVLGSKQWLTTTLSPGNHTITFEVMDFNGAWSKNVTASINVNALPIASIDSLTPANGTKGDIVSFVGSGFDSDGTIIAYQWWSSIDGNISTNASFKTDKLSVGIHEIRFTVQDERGGWSEEDNVIINVNTKYSSGNDDGLLIGFNIYYLVLLFIIVAVSFRFFR